MNRTQRDHLSTNGHFVARTATSRTKPSHWGAGCRRCVDTVEFKLRVTAETQKEVYGAVRTRLASGRLTTALKTPVMMSFRVLPADGEIDWTKKITVIFVARTLAQLHTIIAFFRNTVSLGPLTDRNSLSV